MLSECRPHLRHQLRRRARLGDVVGRARLARLRDGLVAAVGGDEDDWQVGLFRPPLRQLDAVDIGQHQVEQDQLQFLGAVDARQVLRRARHECGVAGRPERAADEPQHLRVVDDEDTGRRVPGPRPAPGWRRHPPPRVRAPRVPEPCM